MIKAEAQQTNRPTMEDKPVEKHDLDISRSQFEVLGIVPSSNSHQDTGTSLQDSKSKMGLPAKIKEKITKITHRGHDKDQSDPSGLEESGHMRIQSDNSKPRLERHISSIPENDNLAAPESNTSPPLISPKLERHISSIPYDDYDSETEGQSGKKAHQGVVEKHDSGTAGSDFEVGGLMHINSDDSGKKSPEKANEKPGLERPISAIPQRDDDGKKSGTMSKLERTISQVPQDDFDSDGEDAVRH